MDERNRIRFLEATLARLLQWISAAEARIALIFGIHSGMLGALAAFAPTPDRWTIAAIATAAVSAFALMLGVAFLALASFPRIAGPKQSVIYFGGIVSRNDDHYLAIVREFDVAAYIDDLARQCHRNAQIAAAKFHWLRRGLVALFVAFLPWTLTIFLLYQQRP
jgi:Family of unknown function (DUF5706)